MGQYHGKLILIILDAGTAINPPKSLRCWSGIQNQPQADWDHGSVYTQIEHA